MPQAGVVECDILQYRADRLYFPLGEEDNVLRLCAFTVIRDNDTLYSGKIEASHPGICYSHPTGGFFDTLHIDSLHTLVETYEVGTSSPTYLGTTGFEAIVDSAGTPANLTRMESKDAPMHRGSTPEGIHLVHYESHWEMRSDYAQGILDGYFSYQPHPGSESEAVRLSVSAPYYAALIPGVKYHYRDNSILTTSLYYRFDETKHNTVFDGDSVQAADCLNCSYSGCPRSIWFNPGNGKDLIKHIRNRNRKYTIVAEDKSLEPTALFFTDILSRDRLKTELKVGDTDGNCHVVYVPIESDSLASCLRFIHNRLAAGTAEGKSASEATAIVGNYLDLGDSAPDSETRERFYRQAEVTLQEIGVFPLFRPTVFFTSHKYLRGAAFDTVGRFVTSDLVHLTPPEQPPESTP